MSSIDYSFGENGELTIVIDADSPVMTSIFQWLLRKDVVAEFHETTSASGANAPEPVADDGPSKHRTVEERVVKKKRKMPTKSIRERIIDGLKEISPCSQSALWSHLGLAAGPGPQHRIALKTLINDGVVTANGSAQSKTLELA